MNVNSWPKRDEIRINAKNREFAKTVLAKICDKGNNEIQRGNADGQTFTAFVLGLLETCIEPELGLPDWEIRQ